MKCVYKEKDIKIMYIKNNLEENWWAKEKKKIPNSARPLRV